MAPQFTKTDDTAINTIRTLAIDAVAKANSGHPGAPMGLAPVAHVLWNYYMNFNSANPEWINRDRFVLSNGHACMLHYALLHLFGYNITTDDLKNFRQLNSKTPGHPEAETPGIEVTTGPLGQGVSNAVGLAIAQAHLAATYNKPGFDIIDNYIYCIFGDGCMMEGVASEAMSLAGHLQLGNLITFYDDNHISIDGNTNVAFTEDVTQRLEAYGWEVIWVKDGNNDLAGMAAAIEQAKKSKNKPTCIRLTTTIGYGSLQQGTHGVHGSPLKPDDIKQFKEKVGFNPEESFAVPQDTTALYAKTIDRGANAEKEWNELFAKYAQEYPKEHSEVVRRFKRELPAGWEKALPTYTPADSAVASRKLSEIVLTKIHEVLPELVGGSADLTGSNLTRWKDAVDFQPPSTGLGDYSGRYIRYGVREHGMGAIMNGLNAYGGIIPYGGTFLNFVSYAAGAVRLSALSGHHVIWVATHDSIGLGEDGPTHQPIETVAWLRATPNLSVWRPADGNETSAAYFKAITNYHTPSVLSLTRQNLPQLEGSSIEKAAKGGYQLVSEDKGDIYLVSTGSEVAICVAAAKLLKEKGITAGVISLPDWFTFEQQSLEYRKSVFPDGIPMLSVEVYSDFGWSRYSHQQFGLDRFGASAPFQQVYDAFEFNAEGVAKRAEATINFYKGQTVKSPIQRAFEPIDVNTRPGHGV
ncbi:Transketolase [Yarrowia sp. B02]|nr:Transketolase [Yarrowia sp. B02]